MFVVVLPASTLHFRASYGLASENKYLINAVKCVKRSEELITLDREWLSVEVGSRKELCLRDGVARNGVFQRWLALPFALPVSTWNI